MRLGESCPHRLVSLSLAFPTLSVRCLAQVLRWNICLGDIPFSYHSFIRD